MYHLFFPKFTESGVLLLAILKPIKKAKLVKRKICLTLEAGSWGLWWVESRLVSKGWFSLMTTSGQDFKGVFQGCVGRGRGYMQKQQSQLWQSFWNWSQSWIGLISIILIVSSTDNLQFQGQFVPISLRPVLRIVAVSFHGYILVIT